MSDSCRGRASVYREWAEKSVKIPTVASLLTL